MKDEKENSVSAPVQPGPRPKCPKCGSNTMSKALVLTDGKESTLAAACCSCNWQTTLYGHPQFNLADFAAFFPVAAPSAPEVDEKRLAEIRKRLSKVAEGPWFTSSDDASDSPDHKDSGLAMVGTGRSSEWPIARLCEWQNARFIEHAVLDIPYLLEQIESLRRRVPAGQGCSCESGNHANATECHNFGSTGCTGPATVPATPEPMISDRMQGVDCPLCEEGQPHTHVAPNAAKIARIKQIIAEWNELAKQIGATTQGTPEGLAIIESKVWQVDCPCPTCGKQMSYLPLPIGENICYPCKNRAASQKGEEGK